MVSHNVDPEGWRGTLFSLMVTILIVVGVFVYYCEIRAPRVSYEEDFKRLLVPGLTRSLQRGMKFHQGRGISESVFRSSDLCRADIDRYNSEDLFVGYVGKTKLQLAEVHAEKIKRRDSDGDSYGTIFRGLFMVADFHKNFRAKVFVMPDFAEQTFGWLGRTFQKLGGNLEQLENPEFEKAFVVRATDPVEARYILTPDMQERVLALRNRLSNDIRFSFKQSQVFMTIPGKKNGFDPNLSRSASDQGQSVLNQVSACFQVVEDLNLNTRIWTKQ